MNARPKWTSLENNVTEESEYEESEEEEGEESNRCGMICKAICYLLLLLWCIGIGWSIYVIVPVARLLVEASNLSPEDEFVKSVGGCLILDVQHGSSGECGMSGCPSGDCVRWPECRCEDVYSYTFKDTEGSHLTSRKEVKFTDSKSNPCEEDFLGRLTGDADCSRTCEEEAEKCASGIQQTACTKEASTYKIGKNVTCWKPRFSETMSKTVGPDGVRAYECANAKCVKIFDPSEEIKNLMLNHWNSGQNVVAVAFVIMFLVCPCLLAAWSLFASAVQSVCKHSKGQRE